MGWGVYDHPEPKDYRPQRDYCPWCCGSFGEYMFKVDDQWLCDRCFKEALSDDYTLNDIAEALGYSVAKSERIYEFLDEMD